MAEYEFNFVATNLFRNYSLMTLTDHHTNEILQFTSSLCSALNGTGGQLWCRTIIHPHELAAQSLPIAYPTSRSANLTLFLQLHAIAIVALVRLGWY